MEFKIEEIETKEFKPFTLTLTVETEEELLSLWHRFDLPDSDPSFSHSHNKIPEGKIENKHEIWEELDNRLREYDKHKEAIWKAS